MAEPSGLHYGGAVNFVGHAVIARWWSRRPRFLLGAMLPDFAGMIAARPPRPADPDLKAGMALHHATDDVFHRTATFRRWSLSATRDLQGAGVRRGAALGVGHVGVELLLDCALGRDKVACQDYLAAIGVNAEIEWASADEGARFRRLLEILVARGGAVLDPERTAYRLRRTLEHRPRLAFPERDTAVVERWAAKTYPILLDEVPLLLAELERALTRAYGPISSAAPRPAAE